MTPRTAARRRTTTLLLAAGLLLTLAPDPSAAADDVSRAQAQVRHLQSLVDATTAELTEGTRRWHADQAELRRVRLRLKNARRHVAAAQGQVDAASARVALIARRMYMRPLSDGLDVAFTRTPDEAVQALQARASVARIAGGEGQVIHEASVARLRLDRQRQEVESASRRAELLVKRSAAQMATLQALAADTAAKLEAAQDELAEARAERAARERAARSRARAASGAACTGRSTAGQSNGNLDPASLCPLWGAPGHRLRADAARAFNAMSKYHAATRGGPLCVTDSYRSYSEQAALYRSKPGLAAVPGTSEHGWGKAVDLCGGVQEFGTAAHRWMQDNASRFGWYHPEWARQSGSRPEAWHWEFGG